MSVQPGDTGDHALLPEHLASMGGWVLIDGMGWLREANGRSDFWWWHDCPPARGARQWNSIRTIDCSTGERHAILSGSLEGGDLTIGGGSGSIPCHTCGLHGWVRDGRWVTA